MILACPSTRACGSTGRCPRCPSRVPFRGGPCPLGECCSPPLSPSAARRPRPCRSVWLSTGPPAGPHPRWRAPASRRFGRPVRPTGGLARRSRSRAGRGGPGPRRRGLAGAGVRARILEPGSRGRGRSRSAASVRLTLWPAASLHGEILAAGGGPAAPRARGSAERGPPSRGERAAGAARPSRARHARSCAAASTGEPGAAWVRPACSTCSWRPRATLRVTRGT